MQSHTQKHHLYQQHRPQQKTESSFHPNPKINCGILRVNNNNKKHHIFSKNTTALSHLILLLPLTMLLRIHPALSAMTTRLNRTPSPIWQTPTYLQSLSFTNPLQQGSLIATATTTGTSPITGGTTTTTTTTTTSIPPTSSLEQVYTRDTNLPSSSTLSHSRTSPTTPKTPPPTTTTPPKPNDKLCNELFSFKLPEGYCVGLELLTENILTDDKLAILSSVLHPEEMDYGTSLKGEPGQITFFLGRLAIRRSLAIVSEQRLRAAEGDDVTRCDDDDDDDDRQQRYEGGSILRDDYGRPIVPDGFLGSISHKRLMGVAIVDVVDDDDADAADGSNRKRKRRRGIGVDIEQSYTRRRNVGKRVLTQKERDDLGKIKGVTRDEEVLLRFSLKESVYKAMHPLITQYVGFQEAEIYPHENGTATVHLNLKNGAHERLSDVTAHWRRIQGDCFLTSASVTLKDEYAVEYDDSSTSPNN